MVFMKVGVDDIWLWQNVLIVLRLMVGVGWMVGFEEGCDYCMDMVGVLWRGNVLLFVLGSKYWGVCMGVLEIFGLKY